MSTYLITGGAGFIGSHLSDRLITYDHKVVVLDDLSTGKKENVNSECEFIQGSIADTKLLAKLFKNVDFCYHLAATASVQKSIEEWLASHNNNLTSTIKVFEAASENNIPVVYASSAAVYGAPKEIPIKECTIINPLSPYGADKYYCELQAKLFGSIQGLKSVGLRFFNVYGKRQDPNSPYSGVISIFIDRINNGLPVKIFGDGKQSRDFIYVDNVVDALITAQKAVSSDAIVSNVCTGKALTINKLVEVLFNVMGKKVEVEYLPPRAGDILNSVGCNLKMHESLDLGQMVEITQGIANILD